LNILNLKNKNKTTVFNRRSQFQLAAIGTKYIFLIMKNKCFELPFWELGLNPIDMLPPPEITNTKSRKEYYQKNKEAFIIRNLTNHLSNN